MFMMANETHGATAQDQRSWFHLQLDAQMFRFSAHDRAPLHASLPVFQPGYLVQACSLTEIVVENPLDGVPSSQTR